MPQTLQHAPGRSSAGAPPTRFNINNVHEQERRRRRGAAGALPLTHASRSSADSHAITYCFAPRTPGMIEKQCARRGTAARATAAPASGITPLGARSPTAAKYARLAAFSTKKRRFQFFTMWPCAIGHDAAADAQSAASTPATTTRRAGGGAFPYLFGQKALLLPAIGRSWRLRCR